MPEYIERSDAAGYFEKSKQTMWHKDDVVATISSKSNIPSADAVEVVRCKECVFYEDVEDWNGNVHKCCYLRADVYLPKRKPNDFCSYGERSGSE